MSLKKCSEESKLSSMNIRGILTALALTGCEVDSETIQCRDRDEKSAMAFVESERLTDEICDEIEGVLATGTPVSDHPYSKIESGQSSSSGLVDFHLDESTPVVADGKKAVQCTRDAEEIRCAVAEVLKAKDEELRVANIRELVKDSAGLVATTTFSSSIEPFNTFTLVSAHCDKGHCKTYNVSGKIEDRFGATCETGLMGNFKTLFHSAEDKLQGYFERMR